mgnify:FL=1
MVDGRIPRLYVGAVEFDILHRFELARAKLVGSRPLTPQRLMELATFVDELDAQHGPDEWPNLLCAEVEAQATIDAADRELAGPLREVWALVGAEAVAHATAVIARLSVDDAKLFLGGVVLALRNGDLDVLARMAGPLTPRPDNGIAGEVHAGEVPY